MPVMLSVTRTTDMRTSRGDDSTPGLSQILERERQHRRKALRFHDRAAPTALAPAHGRGTAPEPFRAARPRALRSMDGGCIACRSIAGDGAVEESDSDTD